jgi:hypothetical protein
LPRSGHLSLRGRDSRIIATGFNFGKSRIAYCTARIMLATTIGEEDILLVYGDEGESHEIGFDEDGTPELAVAQSDQEIKLENEVASFQIGSAAAVQSTLLKHGKRDMRVLVADTATAYAVWQPVLRDEDSQDPREAFYRHKHGENVIIVGP